MADGPLLIGVVGWKNSGKTTLVERLIPLLARRGLKVATVKHTHHDLRPPDGATDGERHARAGAIKTIVMAPTAWEIDGHRQEDAPPAFADLAAYLAEADIVIVEGFKSAPIPKIEVRRRASPTQEPLAAHDQPCRRRRRRSPDRKLRPAGVRPRRRRRHRRLHRGPRQVSQAGTLLRPATATCGGYSRRRGPAR